MSSTTRARQRRRVILTCVECRKRKQKCDRGQPCIQCIVRGPDCVCSYEKFRSPHVADHGSSSQSNEPSPDSNPIWSKSQPKQKNDSGPALLRHAQDYGYSNFDPLTSMSMLTKVVSGIDIETLPRGSSLATGMRDRIRAEYYGYCRRLPSKMHCEALFNSFFTSINDVNAAMSEVIFREQLARWWKDGYEIPMKEGPERLPADLQFFPALMFQAMAIALQFLPAELETQFEDLKFSPSQTLSELSKEYSECGVSMSSVLKDQKGTMVAVQQSFLRDFWLTNTGDLLQAWNHSGQTVKMAMSIGLHLEPELPPSSNPEELLNTIWMNELRRRIWLNLFVWDNYMALALGRPMFIDLKLCTVTTPIDCNIPPDRITRIPVARSNLDKPTPMTERVLRYQLCLRLCEIRELEAQGSIPKAPEKVKELHEFAIDFRNALPAFFRVKNPDLSWDAELHYLPIHRYLLWYLIDSFLMALHRPYIFTRPKSQWQVYESALSILDSQDQMYEAVRTMPTQFYIGLTFPTFDAAVLLAVVLVSNPERYHKSFSRPYQSLNRAFERLKTIGSVLALAKSGSEILETTIRRVIEAHERSGGLSNGATNIVTSTPSQAQPILEGQYAEITDEPKRVSQSPDAEPWRFEVNTTEMDWAAQNPELFEAFDFSNLEAPMPLKELLLDEELDTEAYDAAFWASAQEQRGQMIPVEDQEVMMDGEDNTLWNFLAGYSVLGDDVNI